MRSNQLVIEGLKVKLGEINTARRVCEQRLLDLARDRDTLTRAIAILGQSTNEGAVSLGIRTGAFARTILDVIREAPEPVSVREIAGVLAKRSERPLDEREFSLVVARVRNAVPRISNQLDGELRGRATYWSVKSCPMPGPK
jgi:hypothetical protein